MRSVLAVFIAFGAAGAAAAQSVVGINLNDSGGRVEVRGVEDHLPARLAGVEPYDAVTHLNGTPVTSMADFLVAMKLTPPDTDVTVTVERKGKSIVLPMTTIAPLPASPSVAARDAIDELNSISARTDAAYRAEGRPAVVHARIDLDRCNDSTFKCLANLEGLQSLELSLRDGRAAKFDFARLKPLAGLKSLRELKVIDCVKDADAAVLKEFTQVTRLTVTGDTVGDGVMRQIAGLTRLRTLSVRGNDHGKRNGVTDEGLAGLAALTRLRSLDLCNTKVRGSGLAKLAGLTELAAIDLERTLVTDEQTRHLAKFPKLRWIDLAHTGVTDAGLAPLGELAGLEQVYLNYCGVRDKWEVKGVSPDADFLASFLPQLEAEQKRRVACHGVTPGGVAKHLAACKGLLVLEMNGQLGIKEPLQMRELGRQWPNARIVPSGR